MATFQQQLQTLISTVEAKKRSLDEIIQALRKAEMEFNGKEIVTLDALRQEATNQANGANRSATYFERITQFFVDHDNHPKTISEIAFGIHGNKPSVANVFYSTYKKLFESHRVPGFRGLAWNMTEEAFQHVAQRSSA